jgi:hypothetical protein
MTSNVRRLPNRQARLSEWHDREACTYPARIAGAQEPVGPERRPAARSREPVVLCDGLPPESEGRHRSERRASDQRRPAKGRRRGGAGEGAPSKRCSLLAAPGRAAASHNVSGLPARRPLGAVLDEVSPSERSRQPSCYAFGRRRAWIVAMAVAPPFPPTGGRRPSPGEREGGPLSFQ